MWESNGLNLWTVPQYHQAEYIHTYVHTCIDTYISSMPDAPICQLRHFQRLQTTNKTDPLSPGSRFSSMAERKSQPTVIHTHVTLKTISAQIPRDIPPWKTRPSRILRPGKRYMIYFGPPFSQWWASETVLLISTEIRDAALGSAVRSSRISAIAKFSQNSELMWKHQ